MGLLNWLSRGLKSFAEGVSKEMAAQAERRAKEMAAQAERRAKEAEMRPQLLRQRRKELVAARRQNAIVQRAARTEYTRQIRLNSWWKKGDTTWKDNLRWKLAKVLKPLEQKRQQIDCEIHGIDVELSQIAGT